ncbi:ABC transporter permease [Sandaracinus amylolyticus]|uniref:ABC transporter permease n=1 Tax=Sandaracinus amylolyticus TaxID=927083 RepID=UPI001F33C24D|nr:ABC transporter permease [Sandaracinus amylolyticus]UJR80908.1 Binding-protein-dependent transport systems inner membrane component [Sandaracinus amylolyticus]
MDPRAWRRFRRNRGAMVGLALVVFVLSTAIFGPFLAPADPDHQFAEGLLEDGTPRPPGDDMVLGADTLGRDELSRLLHGGRASLSAALSATIIAVLIGLSVGAIAGYFGGWLDSLLMQLVDVMQSLPFLLIAITVNRVVNSPSIVVLVVLLGVLSWTTLARVTRTKTMQVRELEFVQAARALGMGEWRILARHVLPNVTGPAIVIGTTLVANTILVESAMSFLGLGVPAPASTWGTMLHDAQDMMSLAPRLVLYPGLLIVATVFGFNLLGEGLRDALDPKD